MVLQAVYFFLGHTPCKSKLNMLPSHAPPSSVGSELLKMTLEMILKVGDIWSTSGECDETFCRFINFFFFFLWIAASP